MRRSTRLSLMTLLVLSAACQPGPKSESQAGGTEAPAGATEAPAAALSDQDKVKIRAVDAEWARAAQAGEGAALAALYTADAVLLPPGEPMVRGAAAKKYWVDYADSYAGPTELNTMVVEGAGGVAHAIGTYKMTPTPKRPGVKPLPPEDGKYIEVLKRQDDGSWRIVYDIWNPNSTPKK